MGKIIIICSIVLITILFSGCTIQNVKNSAIKNYNKEQPAVNEIKNDTNILNCDYEKTSWKTGAESVSEYGKYVTKVMNFAKNFDCACAEQDCYYCRIDGLSWYKFYYPGDRFIVTHQWDGSNHEALIEAYEYDLEGNKVKLLCPQTLVRDSPETCPIIRANDDFRVDIVKLSLYRKLKKEVTRKLTGITRIENVIYDARVEFGELKPEDNISDIYKFRLSPINIKDDTIYIELQGGEIKEIYTYSIETLNLAKLCEDTWAIGGGNHSNFSCQMPIGSTPVIDYLISLKKQCKIE